MEIVWSCVCLTIIRPRDPWSSVESNGAPSRSPPAAASHTPLLVSVWLEFEIRSARVHVRPTSHGDSSEDGVVFVALDALDEDGRATQHGRACAVVNEAAYAPPHSCRHFSPDPPGERRHDAQDPDDVHNGDDIEGFEATTSQCVALIGRATTPSGKTAT